MAKMNLYTEKSDVVYVTQFKDPFFTYLTGKVFEAVDFGKKGRFLDLGCGSGRVAFEAAKHGFSVVGVDYVSKAIDIANAEAKRLGLGDSVKFIRRDLMRLKPQEFGKFNYIVLMEVIEHIEDYYKVIDFAYASLYKGGKLLITTPNDPGLWTVLDDYAHHVRRFTPSVVGKVLNRFSDVKIYTIGFPLHRFFMGTYNVLMQTLKQKHRPQYFRPNRFVSMMYYIFGSMVMAIDNVFPAGDRGTTIIAVAEK